MASKARRLRRRSRWGAAVVLAAASIAVTSATGAAASRVRPHASARAATVCRTLATVASCVRSLLAPAKGTNGLYLRVVGGPVLATGGATVAYEPASSIKPLIALYALTQVREGRVQLTTRIPRIDGSAGTEDCPPSRITGTDPLGTALRQMLQISDNNRTRELMQYFGVSRLNAFATSLGLTATRFHTSRTAPGFNVIGCTSYGDGPPLPRTLDGNTTSLVDASRLWTDIASEPAPYASAFEALAAGREMQNTQGYDFTGQWPAVLTLAREVAPASMSQAGVRSFLALMDVSTKGGSYDVYDCTSGPRCEASWLVFAGNAVVPSCTGTTVHETRYTWGYYVADAISAYRPTDPPSFADGAAADGQLLAPLMARSLATWARCAPRSLPVLALAAPPITSPRAVALTTTLATVRDTAHADVSADLRGVVEWGDGTSSVATLDGGDGTFTVRSWHAYRRVGVFHATITVVDEWGGRSARTHLRVDAH